MADDRWEPVEIEGCWADAETDEAVLVTVYPQDKQVWIPKSQILDDSEVFEKSTDGTLLIPRWLAEDKELV